MVYDRWGNLVFQSDNYDNQWDARDDLFRHALLPADLAQRQGVQRVGHDPTLRTPQWPRQGPVLSAAIAGM